MPAVWQAIPVTEFEVRHWDSQTVIFHKGTGDTHLFDAFGWALFQSLQEAPRDSQTLLRSLAGEQGLEDESLHWQVEDLLEAMERMSLIRRTQTGSV